MNARRLATSEAAPTPTVAVRTAPAVAALLVVLVASGCAAPETSRVVRELTPLAVVEVRIDELSLTHAGAFGGGGDDQNVFVFRMEYPAENVDLIESTKSFSIKPLGAGTGLALDLSHDDPQALVFKTALRGEATLTVEAFSLDVPSGFVSFVSGLGNQLIGKWVIGSGPYGGVASSHVSGAVVDLIEEATREGWNSVGRASVILDSRYLENGRLALGLEVAKEVRSLVMSPEGGRPTYEVVVPEGSNGTVTLDVRLLS